MSLPLRKRKFRSLAQVKAARVAAGLPPVVVIGSGVKPHPDGCTCQSEATA